MNATIVAAVQSKLPFRAVASFEDPASFATCQLVTVLAATTERCEILTSKGNRYSVNSLCVDLHTKAGIY
jgi:hypothetical protein